MPQAQDPDGGRAVATSKIGAKASPRARKPKRAAKVAKKTATQGTEKNSRATAKKPAEKATKKSVKRVARKARLKRATWKRAATAVKPRATVAKPRAPASAAKPAAPTPVASRAAQALVGKTVVRLKELLRANDQITTGSRAELVERILDRVAHGNLPRCPTCGLGRLRESGRGGYYCPGGYDDDEYVECNFVAEPSAVARTAWQYGTPGVV
jgi:hypothetical protein